MVPSTVGIGVVCRILPVGLAEAGGGCVGGVQLDPSPTKICPHPASATGRAGQLASQGHVPAGTETSSGASGSSGTRYGPLAARHRATKELILPYAEGDRADHVAGAVMSARGSERTRDVVWHVAHVVVDPPDLLGIRHRVPDEGYRRRERAAARVEGYLWAL